ncbi:MAG: RsiV family protein [Bacteroidales bacterium]|nr:RsiV family protein [Bacteroidales bacterium]
MKATIKTLLPCAIAAAAMLGSCDGNRGDNRIQFENLTAKAAYRLQGTAGDFDCDSDLLWFDSVSIVMPESLYGHDIKPLRDSILRYAFDTIAAPDEAMKAFFTATIEESGYNPVEITVNDSIEAAAEGLTYVNGNVASLSGDWLTYCVTTAVNMPRAAHGLSINKYITYAMNEGRILTLSDIFTPEGIKALPAIIRDQAKRMADIIGPTSITALPSGDNFMISNDGSIIFAYQPYEVASYAQGEIRIPFYAYQLSEYMSPTGLRLFHLYSGE